MDLGLRDKVALVAGGSRGCGLGVSETLVEEGASVVLTGRQADIVEQAVAGIRAKGGKAHGVVADLGKKEDVRRIVDEARAEFGNPDILVVNPPGPTKRSRGFENTPDEEFREGHEQWVMVMVHLAREVLPAMKSNKWGRLVNIASIGMKMPHLEDPIYTQNTRVAVAAVMKTLAHEHGKYNITANTIATGPFLTEFSRMYMAEAGALAEEYIMSKSPMGRWGRPEEMGAVVAFLCSEKAGYVSGETILVDGCYYPSLF